MAPVSTLHPPRRAALETCVSALRRIAGYQLEPVIANRLHSLGERKEELNETEHAELMALVSFTERRTIEKVEAQLALERLAAEFPEVSDGP